MSPFSLTLEYSQITKNFLEELVLASQGQSTSIAFIKHQLHKNPLYSFKTIQAFVIGGTNFITSLATITKNGKVKEISGTRKEGKLPKLTKQTLLTFLQKEIRKEAEAVAINFAFPLKPVTGNVGEIDGILQGTTKEHELFDLIGNPIGTTIKKLLGRDIPIAVANDTVCLAFMHDSLVVGSGFNISIHSGQNTIVNLEAGNFNKFPQTPELTIIDDSSIKSGQGRFEKMLSGTYLPQQYNLLAKNNNFTLPQLNKSEQLTTLAQKTSPKNETLLSRFVLQRSASLVACALAAIYAFKNQQKLIFTTEGSVFWKAWNYKKNVQKQLELLDVPKDAITFKNIPDSAIKGAFSLLT